VIKKLRNPFLTHVLSVEKNRATKTMSSVGNVHRIRQCVRSLFSSCLMQPIDECVQWRKRFSRRALEDREMHCLTPSNMLNKNEVQGNVRQRTLVALVKNASLHVDCWKTADGLEWAGYDVTWRAWALYRHSDIECLLMESNCTELQPSINIWTWVAWLFCQPV
jgi:hypothetical protein